MAKKVKTPSTKIIARKVGNKPYYEIKYYDMEDKMTHIGYSSYDLKKVVGWIVEYFDIIPDIDLIKEQPTADVLPVVHGFWIDINNYGIKERKCSNCGKKDNPKTAIKGHYCWNCGARMDGENNA